jgi:hypothetical protein
MADTKPELQRGKKTTSRQFALLIKLKADKASLVLQTEFLPGVKWSEREANQTFHLTRNVEVYTFPTCF